MNRSQDYRPLMGIFAVAILAWYFILKKLAHIIFN